MQLQLSHKAQPFFERYIQLCEDLGPQPAYHNLPDSFLLQQGVSPKWMIVPGVALVGGAIARIVAARCSTRTRRSVRSRPRLIEQGALEHAKKAFGCAADDDEKLTAHKT